MGVLNRKKNKTKLSSRYFHLHLPLQSDVLFWRDLEEGAYPLF